MAEPNHETDEIPQLTDELQVFSPSAVRGWRLQPVSKLLESLGAHHYAQVPLDRDVPAIPARRATYFRLVVPSPIKGRTDIVEVSSGLPDKPEEAAGLKAKVAKHLGEIAERKLVHEMYGLVGADMIDRVVADPRNEVIAGVTAGYIFDGASGSAVAEPTAHFALIYPRRLQLTEHLLQRKIETMREQGGVPVWLGGIESSEPAFSAPDARTTRLAGMMAQSIILHTFDR
jgi:hypothetical protein